MIKILQHILYSYRLGLEADPLLLIRLIMHKNLRMSYKFDFLLNFSLFLSDVGIRAAGWKAAAAAVGQKFWDSS